MWRNFVKPHLELWQYRLMDLFFFGVILALCEGVINMAASVWFPDQLYTVSAVAGVTAIVMVRWKGWAAVHAVLGAIVMCMVLGATREQYVIYALGNLLGLIGLALTAGRLRAKIYGSGLYAIFFGVAVLVLMQSGRALVSLAFGYGIGDIIRFYTTDSLSALFTALIIWVARRQDGLLEDQIGYIKRVQEEEDR